jgi:metal-responsive CopG/Arc/MetJ family transcriptional regulator
MQRLAVDLPEELHKRLKVSCAQKGVRVSDVVRKLVEDYLEKEGKKTKKQA